LLAILTKQCHNTFVAECLSEFQWSSVAFLGEQLFALSSPSSKQVDVFNANDFSTLGSVTLVFRGSAYFVDMAACCFYKCLYLSDARNARMVRLKWPSEGSAWIVDDIGSDSVVSVTRSHDVLVMCDKSNKLKLFGTDGLLRMAVDLQPDIVNVTSAVELIAGHYLVTHGKGSDNLHRVCLVNSEGKILHAYGSSPLLDCPKAVAVDRDGFVYVIEEGTDRLLVLNPTLEFIHCIKHDLPSGKRRLKIDNAWKRVFVRHCHPSVLNATFVTCLRFDRRYMYW